MALTKCILPIDDEDWDAAVVMNRWTNRRYDVRGVYTPEAHDEDGIDAMYG